MVSNGKLLVQKLPYFFDLIEKKLPMKASSPDSLFCNSCLLPMQYQVKKQNSFVWQCFKCGKKYFVTNVDGNYKINESWSSPK